MKQVEAKPPDPLFAQVERLAKEQHMTLPELLRLAAEQLLQKQIKLVRPKNPSWILVGRPTFGGHFFGVAFACK